MKLIKNIFKTLLILIALLVIITLACFGMMMIFHVDIFGYTYVKQANSIALTQEIDVLDSSDNLLLENLNVETSNLDIIIRYSSAEQDSTSDIFESENPYVSKAKVIVWQEFSGIFKKEVKEVSYVDPASETQDANFRPTLTDGSLTIKTKEPTGFFFTNNSHVEVILPRHYTLGKTLNSLTIETATKNVEICKDEQLAVKTLNVTSNKNSFDTAITIGSSVKVQENLNLNTNFGKIVIGSQLGSNANVNINSKAGSILINANIGGDVNISGEMPYVSVGTLPAELKTNENYDISTIEKFNIGGSLMIDECTGGGNVKVSGAVQGQVYINASRLEFWANDIVGGLTCVSGANNIRIFGTLSGNSTSIKSGDGYLYINNCKADAKLFSSKGGIKIANAFGNIEIENKNSDTTVNFADSASGKTLSVTNDNGNIKVTNIKGIVNLVASRGSIEAYFADVVGDNVINAYYNAKVYVKDGKTFSLTTRAISAKPNVMLGSVSYTDWSGENVQNDNGWNVRTDIVNSPSADYVATKFLKVIVQNNGVLEAKFY